MPAPDQLAHEPVDLGLGADVDPLGRLVKDEHRGVGRQPPRQRHFLLVSPREVAHARCERRGFDSELPDEPQRRWRAPGGSRGIRTERRRGVSRAWCWPPSSCRGSRRGGGGPRGRRRSPGRPPWPANRSPRAGRRAGPRPCRAGVRPNKTRASSVRPAPTSPASPRISPARTLRVTSRTPALWHPRSRTSRTTSPGSTNVLGKTADSSRPTIIRISSPRDTSAISRVPTSTPSRKAVTRSATLWQLFEAMGDVDDADPAATSGRR